VSQTNVFGEPIDEYCSHPMTGYFRDGFCRTSKYNQGSHTVCALITDAFLLFLILAGMTYQHQNLSLNSPVLRKVNFGVCLLLAALSLMKPGAHPKCI